jgi:hypothetical protein
MPSWEFITWKGLLSLHLLSPHLLGKCHPEAAYFVSKEPTVTIKTIQVCQEAPSPSWAPVTWKRMPIYFFIICKCTVGGWRDGSVVKSTDCSSKGPEFKSQQPYGGSQSPIMRSDSLFCRAWWRTPLIPALGRQRQPGLQSEFQDSQSYTEKPCLEKTNKQTKRQYEWLWE